MRSGRNLWMMACSESRKQVEENLKRLEYAPERSRINVGCSKIEYMCVNETEASGTVRLQGVEVEKAHEFKCSKEMKTCRKGGDDGEKCQE